MKNECCVVFAQIDGRVIHRRLHIVGDNFGSINPKRGRICNINSFFSLCCIWSQRSQLSGRRKKKRLSKLTIFYQTKECLKCSLKLFWLLLLWHLRFGKNPLKMHLMIWSHPVFAEILSFYLSVIFHKHFWSIELDLVECCVCANVIVLLLLLPICALLS